MATKKKKGRKASKDIPLDRPKTKLIVGKASSGDSPVYQIVDSENTVIHQFADYWVTSPLSQAKGRPPAAWQEPVRAWFDFYLDELGELPSFKTILSALEAQTHDFGPCIREVDTEDERIWYMQGDQERHVSFSRLKSFLTTLRKEARG